MYVPFILALSRSAGHYLLCKTKLSNLDIGNNGIGHEAGPYLAAYIKDDDELSSLNLYMNELCDLGAIEICNALKHNAGIEILDIGGNNILAAGAEACRGTCGKRDFAHLGTRI